MNIIITATDPNGVIGKNGQLPWRLPEDLKLFRERTLGCPIIAGRVTWNSIPPDKKPLEKRANVVISKNSLDYPPNPSLGPFQFHSLKTALEEIKTWGNCQFLQQYANKDIYIIGGAMLYKTALDEDLVDKIIMTKIDATYEGDVYFPKLSEKWMSTSSKRYEGFSVVEFIKNLC